MHQDGGGAVGWLAMATMRFGCPAWLQLVLMLIFMWQRACRRASMTVSSPPQFVDSR